MVAPSPGDPPAGPAQNVFSTFSSIGRGQGLLPRSPELLTSPPMQMSFTRGRGLGRGAVASPSLSSVASGMSGKVPLQPKAMAPSSQTPSSGTPNVKQDSQPNGTETKLGPEVKTIAHPPELVGTEFDCRGFSNVLEVDSDSYSDSDHGDDLTLSAAMRHAMSRMDSDDEDLINIGRQLQNRDDKDALPHLPAKMPDAKVSCIFSKS